MKKDQITPVPLPMAAKAAWDALPEDQRLPPREALVEEHALSTVEMLITLSCLTCRSQQSLEIGITQRGLLLWCLTCQQAVIYIGDLQRMTEWASTIAAHYEAATNPVSPDDAN